MSVDVRVMREALASEYFPWSVIRATGIGTEAVSSLVALADDPDDQVAGRAVRCLGQTRDSNVLPILFDLCLSPRISVSVNAAMAAAELHPRELGPPVIAKCRELPEDQRGRIINILSYAPDASVEDFLLEQLRQTNTPSLARACATVLGRIRSAEAVPLLMDWLYRSARPSREWFASSIAETCGLEFNWGTRDRSTQDVVLWWEAEGRSRYAPDDA